MTAYVTRLGGRINVRVIFFEILNGFFGRICGSVVVFFFPTNSYFFAKIIPTQIPYNPIVS